MSKGGVLSSAKAVELSYLGLEQLGMFLMKWTTGVHSDMRRRGAEDLGAGALYQGSVGDRI